MDQICLKKRSWWRTEEKGNINIEFCIFKLVLVPNVCLNWQCWLFWPNLTKNSMSVQNEKKWTALVKSSFFAYKVFLVKSRKSKHHLDFCTLEFSSKWEFWSWTKFCQKGYFWSKTEICFHIHPWWILTTPFSI